MKIIDMHTHAQDILFLKGTSRVKPSKGFLIRLFEWQKFNWYHSERIDKVLRKRVARETQGRNAMASFPGLTQAMESEGIAHSVVLPIEPYGSTLEVASIAKGDKRIIPFASVDPRDPGRAEKLRSYVEAGCRGLKLHPIIQNFHPAGRESVETVEEFSQYGLPVFFHSGQTAYYVPESESEGYGLPENYVKVLDAFPKVKFVMGHMAMFQASEAIEIAVKHKNVYFDTSFQPLRMVGRAIEKVGVERVMYGSDWPFGRQRYELSVIMKLTESNQELRERLLWRNAEEFLGGV
jgi:hypothetical protein